MVLCVLICGYQHFGAVHCHHLQNRRHGYQTMVWCHNTEDKNGNSYCLKNLKSFTLSYLISCLIIDNNDSACNGIGNNNDNKKL
jgi:hypothetical protein